MQGKISKIAKKLRISKKYKIRISDFNTLMYDMKLF